MMGYSMADVDATIEREQVLRAQNEGKGYACTYCADTGTIPAPEPYGSMGCMWTCSCPAGQEQRDGMRAGWWHG